MRVKIFVGTASDVESNINAWVKQKEANGDRVEIVRMTQSESKGKSGWAVTITLLYNL